MGVKLRTGVNPLEASIDNSTLKIYFLGEVIKEVNIPIAKAITMPRQCNFFKTSMDNAIGYLTSDKYNIIIRYDGSVDVLTKTWILLDRVHINAKAIMDERMAVCFCGSLALNENVAPGYLAIASTGQEFIFSKNSPISILLDLSNPINKKISEWAKSHDDVGTMHIFDGSSRGSALWVNFGTVDNIQMKDYQILYSKGMVGGVIL